MLNIVKLRHPKESTSTFATNIPLETEEVKVMVHSDLNPWG
jgi:hypothetical protein